MKKWIVAFRLRSLPLAIACIGMGSFIAAADSHFNIGVLVFSLLTAAMLQILSNLSNDYGDSIHGADGAHRVGPSRAVQSGAITQKAMFNAMIVFAILSLGSGIGLLVSAGISGEQWLYFLGLGVLSIIAAITYTAGKKPYGYAGLGDISVFIFFGWVGVLGTYFLHTQYLDLLVLLPASSCSFFAVAVLNVNNIRDIPSDKIAGKKSIPVRLGREKAVFYHWFLLSAGLICAVVYTLLTYQNIYQYLFLITTPLLFINARAVLTKKEAKDLDPFLKQMALTTLLFVLTFGIGLLIG